MDSLHHLKDHEIQTALNTNLALENKSITTFLKYLHEFDRRKLYLRQAESSLFSYCTNVLKLAESCAYKRIQVCRLIPLFPQILGIIENGQIHLTGLNALAPHLTKENADELLEKSKHKTKREIEEIIAVTLNIPKPSDRTQIRLISTSEQVERDRGDNSNEKLDNEKGKSDEDNLKIQNHPLIESENLKLAARISFTCSPKTFEKLKRAAQLQGHSSLSQDLDGILENVLNFYLKNKDPRLKEPKKRDTVNSPPADSRFVPALLKWEVFRTHNYQCCYTSTQGKRCPARTNLEIEHIIPFAKGGKTELSNLQLFCKAHNLQKARDDYGNDFIEKKVAARKQNSEDAQSH